MSFAPKGGYKKPESKSLMANRSESANRVSSDPGQLAALSRPVGKTSLYFFQWYKIAWRWCFVTLIFDFLIILALPAVQPQFLDQGATEIAEGACIVLLLIALSWFIRDWILSAITGWNYTRGKLFKFIERNPYLLFIAVGLVIAAEVLLKVGEVGIWSSVLAVVVVAGTLKSLKKTWQERLVKEKDFNQDLSLQIEVFNLKLFLLHLIPLMAARLTVLLAATTFALSLNINPTLILAVSVGCILISLMPAEEQYFMIQCRRCGTKTSRFLAKFDECLACIQNK